MKIDPREAIYRPFWTQANGSMLESQNYYSPRKAIARQYGWTNRGLPSGRTMSYPNLPSEPLDEDMLRYGGAHKMDDPFMTRSYTASDLPQQQQQPPPARVPVGNDTGILATVEKIWKAIVDLIRRVLIRIGLIPDTSRQTTQPQTASQQPQQTAGTVATEPSPYSLPPEAQIGEGGPFATHTTIFSRQVVP
jgi:hypothetical protein